MLLTQKILSLAIMVAIGFAVARVGLVKVADTKGIATMIIYVLSPCMLLQAFQVEFNPATLQGLEIAVVGAAVAFAVALCLSRLARKLFHMGGMEEASMGYTNCGNLLVPLILSLLGRDYLLYASAFQTFQTVFLFTHALHIIAPQEKIDLKKIIFNPNIISILVGLVLFFTGLRIPHIAEDAVEGLAACIGPASMFNTGILLEAADLGKIRKMATNYIVLAMRLLVLPTTFVLLVAASRVTIWLPAAKEILLITTLAACAPIATTICQFSSLYNDEETASRAGTLGSVSTVAAVATMPLITLLYQTLC